MSMPKMEQSDTHFPLFSEPQVSIRGMTATTPGMVLKVSTLFLSSFFSVLVPPMPSGLSTHRQELTVMLVRLPMLA